MGGVYQNEFDPEIAAGSKAWKDSHPARIFAEWWYCYGFRCAEKEWEMVLQFFAENFCPKAVGEDSAVSMIKLIALVFWAVPRCSSDKYSRTERMNWYSCFKGCRTLPWTDIYFPFVLLKEPTLSMQDLEDRVRK